MAPPNITSVTSHSVSGSVHLEGNTAGSGEAAFLVLQYRVHGGAWMTGLMLPPSSAPFTLEGLPADAVVDVRALLLDSSLNKFESVPQTRVQTSTPLLLRDVAVAATKDGLHVSWNSGRPASVEYQCVRVLNCPEGCESPGHVSSAGGSALLQGLRAHALYRVTVAVDGERNTVEVVTLPEVPVATVESLAVVLASNTSIVTQWSPPRSCVGLLGPLLGYRWELHSSAGLADNITGTTLTLRDLPPGQTWQFRVAVVNPAGTGPWTAINVTTLHSPPSAPLQVAAYRWDRKTVRLRWAPPAAPGGQLASYVLRVAGQPAATLPAGTRRCAAWPDLVCHTVPRAGAARLNVSLTATNEWGDMEGDAATASLSLQDNEPGLVEDLQVVLVTSAKALLRWRLPLHLHGDLAFFRVAVEAHGSQEGPDATTMDVREERPFYEHTLSGLEGGAAYTAAVQCGTRTRLGAAASVTFTTHASIPVQITTPANLPFDFEDIVVDDVVVNDEYDE